MEQKHKSTSHIPALWDYWRSGWAMLSLAWIGVLTVVSVMMDYYSIAMQGVLGDAMQAMDQALFFDSLYRFFFFLLAFFNCFLLKKH